MAFTFFISITYFVQCILFRPECFCSKIWKLEIISNFVVWIAFMFRNIYTMHTIIILLKCNFELFEALRIRSLFINVLFFRICITFTAKVSFIQLKMRGDKSLSLTDFETCKTTLNATRLFTWCKSTHLCITKSLKYNLKFWEKFRIDRYRIQFLRSENELDLPRFSSFYSRLSFKCIFMFGF